MIFLIYIYIKDIFGLYEHQKTLFFSFFIKIRYTSCKKITSKKANLKKQNNTISKSYDKTSPNTSDIYIYGEVLHIIADTSNTTFRKAKIGEEIKIIGEKVALEVKVKQTYKRKTQQ